MANGNGGLLKNVQWLSLIASLVINLVSFSAVAGAFIVIVDSRIEKNVEHLDRVDDTISKHSAQIAAMLATQNAAETAVARLEERISALVETQRAQGETLQRIEDLLQRMMRESYGPRQRFEENQP